jgi:hypothetical protein
MEQLEKKSLGNGLFPDERLHRCLTSEHSIFSKKKHAQRQSDKSLTIMISRDEEKSWIFEGVNFYGKKHPIVHGNWETRTFANWAPGEYDADEVFCFIGTRYAFGEDSIERST